MAPRGSLIAIEGGDKAGKSTCSKLLEEVLRNSGVDVTLIQFPNRVSETGKIIDAYLKRDLQLHDKAIHLIFAANRWEEFDHIKLLLTKGTTVILDRYCMSGCVYSTVLRELDWGWCFGADKGQIKPDHTFLLSRRFNDDTCFPEKFERVKDQEKVRKAFQSLVTHGWEIVNTNGQLDEVVQRLVKTSLGIIASHKTEPLSYY